ncbi:MULTISPECIES: right-handed parallel beta-helix repeat-containing protein [Sphingobacterium]|uniref:right-handed parallel beta-helix repeat-containing protein n=1 Tax=Sphingobacterium TaxID=28453 RepID=UPI0013D93560|nr:MULTISPECIES: right-handed parallel beta-helix repeat-containing protein [unclassified Sphingobacterium]
MCLRKNIIIAFVGISAYILFSLTGYAKLNIYNSTILIEPKVNITNFGGKGDNIFDNTVSIKNAIVFLAQKGGGTLYFPKGKYKTTSFIIPSNIKLVGDGSSSELINITSSENHFIAIRGNNVEIESLFLNGNRKNRINGKDAMEGSTISIATDAPDNFYNRTYNVRIRKCRITTNGFDAIGVWNSNDVTIEDNYCLSGRDSGIDIVEGSYNIIIKNNVIYNNDDGCLFLIALDSFQIAKYGLVRNVEIFNNVIYNRSKALIPTTSIFSIESCENVSVENNRIFNSGEGTGIKIFQDANNIIVKKNKIEVSSLKNHNAAIEVNNQNSKTKVYKKITISDNILKGVRNVSSNGVNIYMSNADVNNNTIENLNSGIYVNTGGVWQSLINIENNVINECNISIELAGDFYDKTDINLQFNKTSSYKKYNYAISSGYNIFNSNNPITGRNYLNKVSWKK